ncbi:MAG: PPOX class F420-dependent oxidoreductase [Anaerolineae bacterium]
MSHNQGEYFGLLHGHTFMNLATYRRSGVAVVTPVWFAAEGDTLYVMTLPTSGKVKRIRREARVQVGPADMRGTPLGGMVEGRACLLDGEEAKKADRALSRKYGLQKVMFQAASRLRGQRHIYLAITPGGDGPPVIT